MYDSFIAQLAGLDLASFSFQPAPFNETDFPPDDAAEQTIGAVWSDLFALFADTALEADAEDIAWGFVNLFHRAGTRKSASLDRAADEIRALLAAADGSEVHSSNLEEQVERAQAAEASMLAFEQMREVAASLYRDETGSSWKPMSGSRASHSKTLTSAVIDARDFLKVRAERRRAALTPEGTLISTARRWLVRPTIRPIPKRTRQPAAATATCWSRASKTSLISRSSSITPDGKSTKARAAR